MARFAFRFLCAFPSRGFGFGLCGFPFRGFAACAHPTRGFAAGAGAPASPARRATCSCTATTDHAGGARVRASATGLDPGSSLPSSPSLVSSAAPPAARALVAAPPRPADAAAPPSPPPLRRCAAVSGAAQEFSGDKSAGGDAPAGEDADRPGAQASQGLSGERTRGELDGSEVEDREKTSVVGVDAREIYMEESFRLWRERRGFANNPVGSLSTPDVIAGSHSPAFGPSDFLYPASTTSAGEIQGDYTQL